MSTLDVGLGSGDIQRPRSGDRSAFTIGGVLRRLTSVCIENGGVLLILAIVVWVVPYVVSLLSGANLATFSNTRPGVFPPGGWFVFVSGLVASAVVTIVGEGAIIHVTAAGRGGWDLATPLKTGARFFWPNIAIYFVKAIAIGFASILLVFPGLMLMCRWLVAIQAAVAEGTGIRASLGRSRDLTRGYRWRIFGLILIAGVAAALLQIVTLLLTRALGGSGSTGNVIVTVLSAVISIVTTLVFYVGATAIYLELRDVKEGGATREMAAVFE